jgi:hypothetical protein
VDEIKVGVRPEGVADQIEIDLVVRCGNQLGIVEAKMGASKAGIDQLSTAGGARYLGTYTARFLVVGRRLYSQHKTLAQARNVIVIEMPGYTDGRALGRDEADRLRRTIRTGLGAVT